MKNIYFPYKSIGWLWPFDFGQDRILDFLKPPMPAHQTDRRKIKRFPLTITYNPQTYFGRQVYYFGIYEPGVITTLKKLLKKDMSFVDVGANYGIYSLIASYLVGSSGSVLSVEPQKKLCDIVQLNIDNNRLSNCVVCNCAVSSHTGIGSLYFPSTTNDGQATLQLGENERSFHSSKEVNIDSLDNIIRSSGLTKVDGLKIDVEGAELEVLKSAEETFEKNPFDFILFECIEPHLKRFNASTSDVFDFLIDRNYSIFCLFRGKWHPVSNIKDHSKYYFSSDLIALHRAYKHRLQG